ncbi:MAG: hypothetical protein IPF68_16425 [Bacteroidales bacterium]|nr:hypothetical protein [Bacteroidales bacterium]
MWTPKITYGLPRHWNYTLKKAYSPVRYSLYQCFNRAHRQRTEGCGLFPDGSAVFCKTEADSPVSNRDLPTNTVVLQVIPDKNGFWLADTGSGYYLYCTTDRSEALQFQRTQGRAVFKMVKDRSGSIWACQDPNTSIIRMLPDFTTRFYSLGEEFVVQGHCAHHCRFQ